MVGKGPSRLWVIVILHFRGGWNTSQCTFCIALPVATAKPTANRRAAEDTMVAVRELDCN